MLYVLAMLRPVMPLFNYVINQDYIAEFLCINQDKPELECNGKCYLMQRLSEENKQKKENLPKIALEEYPIGFINLFAITKTVVGYLNTTTNKHYYNNYSFIHSDNCFHPPDFCS